MTALQAHPGTVVPETSPDAAPERPDVGSRWSRVWPALVPALVLSVAYARTLQRGTGNGFSIDTTKFDYLGLVLGTAHPPGYPLYTLLDAAVVRLVPLGSVAMRVNLLSGVFAVLTCMLLVGVLQHLGVSRTLATGGATATGLLLPVWRFAVVAEVYTLTLLFLAAVLACLLRFESTGRRGWLRVGVLVFALSFSHATSDVLLVPGLLLYLAARRPTWLFRPRELLPLLAAGVLLALGPYAYLPWRTAVGGSTYLDTRVDDLRSFWGVVTGQRYAGEMFDVPLPTVWHERLPELGRLAWGCFGPLLPAAVVGLVVLARWRPRIGWMTVAWVLVSTAFVLGYRVGDWSTMLLPVWLVVALWVVVGLDRTLRLLGRPGRVLAAVVALALPVSLLVANDAAADRSAVDPQPRIDAAIEAVVDHSIIFTVDNGTRHLFSYRLLPHGLGARRDVWVSRGPRVAGQPDLTSGRIRQYCAPETDPWVWGSQERAIAPSVARGLHTYVYGRAYARTVRGSGIRLQHVGGQLYRFTCPTDTSAGVPPAGR